MIILFVLAGIVIWAVCFGHLPEDAATKDSRDAAHNRKAREAKWPDDSLVWLGQTNNMRAKRAEALEAQQKQEMQREECPHDEHDHGICLDCGKDIFDDLVASAEFARDYAEDR